MRVCCDTGLLNARFCLMFQRGLMECCQYLSLGAKVMGENVLKTQGFCLIKSLYI